MISQWRTTFREQYAWLLLPVFLVVAFTVDSRTGAANVMRVLCFPLVLIALTTRDYKAIWANPAARAFYLFILWLNLTLVWDGLSETDRDFFQRNIYLFTLMGMVYLVAAYRPERQSTVFHAFLLGGFACAVLILRDWPGTPAMIMDNLKQMDPATRESLIDELWYSRLLHYTRGILSLSHYVGWMMAVLLIASLYAALHVKPLKSLIFYAGAALFATVLIFSQARGAWVGAMVGTALLLLLTVRFKTLLWLTAVLALVLIGLFTLPGMEQVWEGSVDRGDSFRLYIWQKALPVFTADPLAILVGFGQSVPTNYVAGHSHLHNIYLNTLSYGGLVALALYGWLLWQVALKLRPYSANALLVALLACMQVAFLVDGEYLFVAPSAMMLAYLLPLMWAMFGFKPCRPVEGGNKANPMPQPGSP